MNRKQYGWRNGKFSNKQWSEDYNKDFWKAMPATFSLAYIAAILIFVFYGLVVGWQPITEEHLQAITVVLGLFLGSVLVAIHTLCMEGEQE